MVVFEKKPVECMSHRIFDDVAQSDWFISRVVYFPPMIDTNAPSDHLPRGVLAEGAFTSAPSTGGACLSRKARRLSQEACCLL